VEAQTRLDGEYCKNDGKGWFESDCIKLNLDGTFEYSMWHCTGTNKGNGTYTIRNGKLNLNFSSPDSLESLTSKVEMNQYDLNENQEASIRVTLYDRLDSTKIQFANIVLSDSSKTNSGIRGTSTDSLGTGVLKIDNANLLTITFIGYERLEIPINNNKNIELTVGLAQKGWINYLTEEDNMSFPIKSIKDDKFLLKRYKKMKYLNYEITKN